MVLSFELVVVYYAFLHELIGKIKVFLNTSVDITFRVNLTFKCRLFWKTKNTNHKCLLNQGCKVQAFILRAETVHLDLLKD